MNRQQRRAAERHAAKKPGMWTYTTDGRRAPFDPRSSAVVRRCVLCGGLPVVMTGVCIPQGEEGKALIMRLRQHPVPAGTSALLAYGLCARHCPPSDDIAEQVEARLQVIADQVVLQ